MIHSDGKLIQILPRREDIMDLKDLKRSYPAGDTFRMGGSKERSSALLDLVRIGKKIATCTTVRDVESAAESKPAVANVIFV